MYREKWKGGWTGWINLVIMEKGYLVMHVCVNVIWTYYNTIMGMWFVPKINLHTCIIRSLVNLTFSFSAYYRYVDVHTYHTLWYTISRFFRSKNQTRLVSTAFLTNDTWFIIHDNIKLFHVHLRATKNLFVKRDYDMMECSQINELLIVT